MKNSIRKSTKKECTSVKEKPLSKRKKAKLIDAMVTDIMPFKGLYRDVPIRRNGAFWEILQITCKDLITASQSELEFDYMCFDKLYRTYSADLKIIGMNFPSDTTSQQEYIRHKIGNTSNEIYLKQLEDKLAELEWISKNLTEREYYLIFYAEDFDDYRDKLVIIERALCNSAIPLIKQVDPQKKVQVLYKYFNKNAFI